MKIGVVGAGNVAKAFATVAVRQGHEVMLSNSRGPETLADLTEAIGCQAGTPEQAAAFGEIVLVAIPLKNYRDTPVAPLAGKVVIDADNYYPERDGHYPELDTKHTTTSEMLAAHLPQSKIVKAFNAIMARDLEHDGRPAGDGGRRALPIAGDDAAAKTLVATLHDQIGFDVVDAGGLSEGWRFQNGTPAYTVALAADELRKRLAATQP